MSANESKIKLNIKTEFAIMLDTFGIGLLSAIGYTNDLETPYTNISYNSH